jgi:hypothetical protein
MLVEFGEYLPDLPDFQNPGATVAKNVIPAGNSYKSFPSVQVYSNALDARCKGAISTKDRDGNSLTFAGNASKLYKISGTTFSNVSVVGGYSTGDERWFFTRFGDRLIATNFNDAIQTYTLASSSAFANLSAGAPKARYTATIRNFLAVANTFDSVDGNVPHRVRWSALDDATDWTVSATTQADYQDLNASNGWCRGIVGGEYGVIFQERAISRMTYVGSPTIWQFDEVETGKGTMASGSIIKVGNFIFYLGLDGFYVFDGSKSTAIGANKVDQTFYNEVDLSYLDNIYSTADFDKQVIYWLYPATGNTGGIPNKILMFNYSPDAKKRWSFAEPGDLEVIFTSLSAGYTLDDLDSFSASLDTLTPSLDSRYWTGDNYLLSGFNTDHKMVNFSGSALTAQLETMEAQVFPNMRAYITRVRPIVDGSGTVTVQMGTRNVHSESVTYGSATSLVSNGDCPVRSNARYHRIRVNISGGFNDAQGVEVLEATPLGKR